MTEIVIDENVPIPPRQPRNPPGPRPIYPIRKMKPGQSFFIPGDHAARNLNSNITNKGLGKDFQVVTCTENGILGARAFRIK